MRGLEAVEVITLVVPGDVVEVQDAPGALELLDAHGRLEFGIVGGNRDPHGLASASRACATMAMISWPLVTSPGSTPSVVVRTRASLRASSSAPARK